MAEHSLLSVGIDVGTTSSHLVLSRLFLSNASIRNEAPRMVVSERVIEYRSKIHLTPITDAGIIDAEKVGELVAAEYAGAGISAADVQTGAVIITGESARKRNASEVISALSTFAGDFVCASAGPHLESILAGRGSGAAEESLKTGKTICNVDIGGGTSNAAVFSKGELLDTSCLGLGGRCLQIDRDRRIVAMTDSGEDFLDGVAKNFSVGDQLDLEMLELIGYLLAETIVRSVWGSRVPQITRRMMLTELLRHEYQIDEYWITGGVGQLLGKPVQDPYSYGDMGVFLAAGLRESLEERNIVWKVPEDAIRATVIGAGSHAMQLSGSTIHVESGCLPIRNVPLVRPFTDGISAQSNVEQTLQSSIERLDRSWSEEPIAIVIEQIADLSYSSLSEIGKRLIESFRKHKGRAPLILILCQDAGMALGQVMRALAPDVAMIVLDGINVQHGDYIDIGEPLPSRNALPVVIKDLIFAR